MNHLTVATLIRGLCIDLSGKPQVVVHDAVGKELNPAGALRVEITSDESEETAALVIRKAYEEWMKAVAADDLDDDIVLLPSCVVLCVNGKPEALYWIDENLDSARKRLQEKNASPRTESPSKPEPLIKAEERAAVVKNRVALVTGGAQGIGEEIVRNLAAAGAFVFIADLNVEGANKLAGEINAAEGRTAALGVEVNVCDEASVEKMFNSVTELTGGLDLCVSNAGVLKAGSVLEQELSDFKFVTDINYTGFFVMSKFAGRLMKLQHLTAPSWKMDIVQVNSKSGLEGSNKNGAYAGGKFGGLGLVASFALELVEYNIKVNALCPGNFLDGPLWSHPENGLFVQYLKTGKVPGAKTVTDVRSFYESKVPMKRGCTGKDLVRALYYVVEQEYETGQAIPVTGGQVMLH
ncbi:MAG: SDR family NAD(P)-dependent oxidoreductase [Treponema sp.]|jgi:sorbitol-6-phosphate 2-dehydrogenase|nr:SDR family NAD(P)-dependent oxidoreductase [Treponema sp.]